MSLRTLFTVLAALSTAYLAVFAAPPTNVTKDDPLCVPPGTHSGFEYNTFQYNVPYDAVYNKIGSFFHSEWYTGKVLSTNGTDNTVGATHVATFGGATFTEKLTAYTKSPGRFSMRFSLAEPSVTWVNLITFSSYTVEIGAVSICEGKATYVEILASYCVDKPELGYDVFDNFNRNTTSAVAREIGALIFAGSCYKGLGQG